MTAVMAAENGLLCIAGGAGDVTANAVQWKYRRSISQLPSTLVYRGVLYMVTEGGILTTLDPASGMPHKQGRVGAAAGKYYASPVAADGKVFFVSSAGAVTIMKAGPDQEVLSVNPLDDECYATPAIADGPLIDATSQPVGRFKLENRRKAPRNGIEPTIGRSTTGQLRMSQQTFDIRISRRDDLPRTQFSEDQSHFPVSRIRVPDTRRARYFLRHPSPTPSGLGFKPAEERRLGNAGADICPARRSPVPRVGALPGNSRNSSCARGSDRPPRAAVCRIGLARSARLHRGAPSKR